MIFTTHQLLEKYKDYKDPFGKIRRMVEKEELFLITKGLYEDNKSTSAFFLAGAIYGPSYISFNTALSYYGLIPEAVYTISCATSNKKKKKQYENIFGFFTYQDVPASVFSYGINLIEDGKHSFMIATKEKALCDKLFSLAPIKSQKELEYLLFVDMRIDANEFKKLNRNDIYFLASIYHSTNVTLLEKYLRRNYHEQNNR